MTLKAKNEAADKLIGIVSAENEIVQKEKLIGEYVCKHNIYIISAIVFSSKKINTHYIGNQTQ